MRKVAMLFIACCICVFLAPISTVTNAHGRFEDEGQISWSDWQENNAINDNEKQEIIEATEAATTDLKPTETTIPPCEHSFTAFEIVEYPLLEKPGLIVKYCTLCGEEVYEEYLCPHDEIQEVITVPPGCEATGMLIRQCCLCETPIEEVQIPATGHSYSEWQIVTYATPLSEGCRQKVCISCSLIVSESYMMTMAGETSIYIPGIGINHTMAIAGFTQHDVDTNDIVYTENAYYVNGHTDPFILGHNTGTLRNLHLTQIGQKIFISVNGKLEVYEVYVSEYAIHSGEREMMGQKTGVDVTARGEGKTLHLYTCHGSDIRGRWIVIAKLIK